MTFWGTLLTLGTSVLELTSICVGSSPTSWPGGFSSALLQSHKFIWPLMASSSVMDSKFPLNHLSVSGGAGHGGACTTGLKKRLTRLVSNSVIERDYDSEKLPASHGFSGLYKALPLPMRRKEKSQFSRDWSTNIFCRLLMLPGSQGLRLPKKQV